MVEIILCLLVPVTSVALILAIWALVAGRRINRALRAELEQLVARVASLEGDASVASKLEIESTQPLLSQAVSEPTPSPATESTTQSIATAAPLLGTTQSLALQSPIPETTAIPLPGDSEQKIAAPIVEPAPAGPSLFDSVSDSMQSNPILRWFMGSHIVVRAGILILFVGIAFLLKYAADQGWFAIELRLTGAGLLGLTLVYAGWYVRARRRTYALTLQGGGLGIAYMTVFTAFRLYDLLPAELAFAVLLGLGAACVALALLNDARSLAILAITGGFAAPILISTGTGDHVILFGYFAILNVAILGIAWFKSWRELNLVGFLFTFILASLWGAEFYQPAYFATVEPFLLLFFLFYVAISILFAVRQPPQITGLVDGPLVFGTPIITAIWQARLVADFEYGLAWSTLGFGLLYLLLAAQLFRLPVETHGRYRSLRESHLALGSIFVTLAIPFAFDNDVTVALWAIEGAALVWLGLRYRRPFHTSFGGLVQLGAGYFAFARWLTVDLTQFLSSERQVPDFVVANPFAVAGILLALAGLATTHFLLAHARNDVKFLVKGDLTIVAFVASIWAMLWWYGTGLFEIIRFVPDPIAYYHAIMLFLVVTAILGEWVGQWERWWSLRAAALLLWIPTAILAPIQAISTDQILANIGWIAWPATILVHYWTLYRVDDVRWLRFYHLVGLWLLTWVGTFEILTRVRVWNPDASIWLALALIAMALLLVLTVILIGQRIPWPIHRHHAFYVRFGFAPLFLILLAWSIIVSLSNAGDVMPLRYLPIVNPLTIANLLIFTAYYLWLGRLHTFGIQAGALLFGRILGIGMILLWVSGDLARVAHQFWSIPYVLAAMLDVPLLQAVYSIFWTLVAMALMFVGTRGSQRWLWLTGAGLLALTVLKLFAVDLSGADTLARIASFIVVGLLMLLIGYVAPLPSRNADIEPPVASDPSIPPPVV